MRLVRLDGSFDGRPGSRDSSRSPDEEIRRLRARVAKLRAMLRDRGGGDEPLALAGPVQRPVLYVEEMLGRRLPHTRGEGWAKPIPVSGEVEVRARAGTRIATVKIRPGLTLLVEAPDSVDEPTLSGVDEIGFIDLLVKAGSGVAQAVDGGMKAGKRGGNAGNVAAEAGKGFLNAFVPGVFNQKAPAAPGPAPASPAAPAPGRAKRKKHQCPVCAPCPPCAPAVDDETLAGCGCRGCGGR